MAEYAIAAMGADRPGIVAAMSGSLTRAGVSIEDSSMTILGGQFAMLLLVSTGLGLAQVESVIRPVAVDLDLMLEVRSAALGGAEFDTELTSGEGPAADADDYVIAAYGPDRPGLVSALAAVLAEREINITNFGSRVGATDTFAMWFNVAIPGGVDVDALVGELRAAGGEVALDVSAHRSDSEEL